MKTRHGTRRSIVGIAVLASLSLLVAACGDDDDTSEPTTAPPATDAPEAEVPATDVPDTEAPTDSEAPTDTDAAAPATDAVSDTTPPADDSAEWDQIVAAAQEEGAVTIYSSQGVDNLNELGKRFEEDYGIKVEVFRAVDNDLHAKVQAELDTGSPIADVIVNATAAWQIEKSDAGWFVPVDLPAFDNPDYNAELNVSEKSDYFAVNAAVLTFGWNTERWPKGLADYPDLLDPELKGKIGVIEPTAGSIVDFWLYLEEKYGSDFTDKLAAQEPRIYPSSLPMGEALISGEIAAGSFVQVQDVPKADGAPVDSGLSDPLWGAIFNGAVLANAPHPNAAILLSDFMLTERGQEAVSFRGAASLPNIEGSIAVTSDSVRRQDLSALTPEFVTEFQTRWAGLFN
jgi:iron(III) transport system substrate-binding protein